ncbi:uncharacterized protein BDR25DRAFT_304724 [Lindgomyces ingoldianus]|uniref:Uncharacterized protein n=1 Tax=Lindgomyces ingoldianus TaxID=673940 RepID=A0ACB6QRI7_9PLEO|nr:uncharacterized protein BDR25DRAFT_304724 [Lindgomyces ingoldianus]KAF2468710.1 hypothetical protein BDR25DRAFT_304724 [Lindgomyces ingoldianus]
MKEGGKEGSEVMGGLKRFVGPCKRLGEKEEDKTATMLRLFRYEGWEEKVVAERHADLGLLSFVIGSTPGLEVWNGTHFIPIEKSYNSPCATLLSGRQLQRLTNYRYPAGGHRVVSYGKPTNHVPASASPAAEHVGGVGGGEVDAVESNYRFSIVFVLRAHEPIIVDTDALTTEITGVWKEKDRIRGITAGEMYAEIRATHFNINTGLKERDEQRRKVAERKRMEMGVSGAG